MYKNCKWRRIRKQILRRDKYLCQESLRFGKSVPGNTVHHIYPVEFYPELKYEMWNLITLSPKVHNMMHDRDSHNLTDNGLALQRRFRTRYLKWCEKKNVKAHFEN